MNSEDRSLTSDFHAVVRNRHSVRSFLRTAVPYKIIESVLEEAQSSPSNCNTQPWAVRIVSGLMRDTLSNALLRDNAANRHSGDFSFDQTVFYGAYDSRSKETGAQYYDALGVTRKDFAERRTVSERNLTFFDAPHVALLFVPRFGKR